MIDRLDDNPWDDAAFKTRVKRAAEQKGISLRAALLAAGVSISHLDKPGRGRFTHTILKLAKALDVSPAYLYGLQEFPETIKPAKHKNGGAFADADARNKRLSLYTKVVAAQLATLVYMASDDPEAESLREFVLKVIDQVSNSTDRGGKGIK